MGGTKQVTYWGPQILGTTIQNLVAGVTMHPVFVRPSVYAF